MKQIHELPSFFEESLEDKRYENVDEANELRGDLTCIPVAFGKPWKDHKPQASEVVVEKDKQQHY